MDPERQPAEPDRPVLKLHAPDEAAERERLGQVLTLRDVYERYHWAEVPAEGTRDKYRVVLNCWERLTDNPPIGAITNDVLARFRDACLETGHRPATFNSNWGMLRVLLRRAGPQMYRNPLGEGIIPRVPHVKRLKEDHDFPRLAEFAELDAIYEACASAEWPQGPVPAPEWWRCLFVLAYNTGARRDDLLGVRMGDIDLERRRVRFTARKTSKRQVVPLNETGIAHIKRIWSERELLLPRGGNRPREDMLHALNDRAGIPEDNRITLQTLRKTCGSTLYEISDRDTASYVLGHNVPGVTAGYYLNPSRKCVETVERMPQPPSFRRIVDNPALQASVALNPGQTPRDAWRFGYRSVAFLEREFPFPPKLRAALQALVNAGRPLCIEELHTVLYWDKPATSRITVKTTVRQLRQALQERLRGMLPRRWDPVPHSDGGYSLAIPATPLRRS